MGGRGAAARFAWVSSWRGGVGRSQQPAGNRAWPEAGLGQAGISAWQCGVASQLPHSTAPQPPPLPPGPGLTEASAVQQALAVVGVGAVGSTVAGDGHRGGDAGQQRLHSGVGWCGAAALIWRGAHQPCPTRAQPLPWWSS